MTLDPQTAGPLVGQEQPGEVQIERRARCGGTEPVVGHDGPQLASAAGLCQSLAPTEVGSTDQSRRVLRGTRQHESIRVFVRVSAPRYRLRGPRGRASPSGTRRTGSSRANTTLTGSPSQEAFAAIVPSDFCELSPQKCL